MHFDLPIRRIAGVTVLGTTVLGLTTAATFAAAHPDAARTALKSIESSVNCATSAACVSGNNTSSGSGVQGQGNSGFGVLGTSTSSAGVKGVANTNDGVYGVSNKTGVAGTSPAGFGVYGFTTKSHAASTGVYGSSPDGYGVWGESLNGNGYGTVGYAGGAGTGSYGFSSSGVGVLGDSSSGSGLYGRSATYTAIYGVTTGGIGDAVYATSAGGHGLEAYSNGPATVFGTNTNGPAAYLAGTSYGISASADPNGLPLWLTDSNSNPLFYVDGTGNVYAYGSYNNLSAISKGVAVQSFTAKSSAPTVEDTGTAQLVGGYAAVRLDSAFATSIDRSTAYRVFLTPDGDTHGLYVAAKTTVGFIVREAQGGHANVAFDYRIVATTLGQGEKRMALLRTANLPVGPKELPHRLAPVNRLPLIPKR